MAMATTERTAQPGSQGPPTVPFPELQSAMDLLASFEQAGNASASHPDYLGEAPRLARGKCTACGFGLEYHVDRSGEQISVRDWHRLDSRNPNGFFADEPVPGVRS